MRGNNDWRVELNRAESDLHKLLEDGMAVDDPDGWVRLLEIQLGELSRTLTGFCRECDHGLYDDCIELAPRLAPQVNKLRSEQAHLQASLQEQIERLQNRVVSDQPSIEFHRSMTSFVHRLGQLNHHAVDLVYSAYDTDLGGPG